MASFKCADIGMQCGFAISGGSSKEEVLQEAQVHARMAHGMSTIPPDVGAKVSAAIH
jgi:predicted small metal-binding protein